MTREQLATVLWRYAGSPNVGAVQDFTDESSISAYAADAVDWARRNGIISGVEGNRFLPQGSATRAQVAVILRNYLTMPASPGEAGDTEVTETVGTQIILTIGDLEIPAVLNDTVAAQSFKELLPFTVTASKGQYDYCGVGGDIAYDEGETQAGWKNGDIGYARGWFALFHSGEEASSSYANEMIIGHIDDSYLDSVRDLPASVEITVEFADAQ